MNPFQFKIPARQKKCSDCGYSFIDEDRIVSTIEGDEEEPIRLDFCYQCFSKKGAPKGWGVWETVLSKPKKILTPDQKAMELFHSLIETDKDELLCFVANYLKRKKQLNHRHELKREGLLFYEIPQTSEIIGIKDSHLLPERLPTLRNEFFSYLQNDSMNI